MSLLLLFISIQQLSLACPESQKDHVNICGIHSMSYLGRQMKNTVQ